MNNKKVDYLKREIKKLKVIDRISQCHKEETTKMFLIYPFLNLLGYTPFENLIQEYNVEKGSVDIAVNLLKSSNPEIFIECKHIDNKLGLKPTEQLNKYCNAKSSVKIGVLTNGLIYNFFSKSKIGWDNNTPFYSFNIQDFNEHDLNILCMFTKDEINFPKIEEFSDEIYFEQSFENGLLDLINNPSDTFLKEIFKYMKGQGTIATPNKKAQLSKLLNVYSLEALCERLHNMNTNINQHIFTTEKEKTFFNIIQGFCAVTNKIPNKDLNRIGYRDMKHQFSILIDDNKLKTVCFIKEQSQSYTLHVNKKKFKLNDIDIVSLDKYKTEIISAASTILASDK